MQSLLPAESFVSPACRDDAGPWFDVVEHSPVAMLVIDGANSETPGQIRFANRAIREMFSHTVGSTPAGTLFDLLDADSHQIVTELLRTSAPFAPAEVDVKVVASVARPVPGMSIDFPRHQLVGLRLHQLPTGESVAQFVKNDGWHAVENVLTQQQRFRSALMELSDLAHTTEDDEVFYQRLIERAVEVVPGAQGGSVQLGIPDTTTFRFVAAVGYDLAGLQEHLLEQEHFFRDAEDPVARIVREFSNEGRSPEIAEWLERAGRISDIVVNTSAPAMVEGRPIAFLSLDNFEDPGAMNETSVEMTTVLSRLIGDLWLRRQLEAEVRKEREAFRHQAMHDPLTGLANRRSLDRSLHEAVLLSRRAKRPTAILFFDIDDFKGVNDRLGHEVGDLLIIGVAKALETMVGDQGVVARWGGDEFLIVPDEPTTAEETLALACNILERFEKELALDHDLRYRARLSAGVGWSASSEHEAIDLLRAADAALYEAKAAGKGTARLQLV